MRYVLRADSSPKIGSGHVMRLSAIAEELILRGQKVIFIGQVTDLAWLASRINSLGFSQIIQSSTEYCPNSVTDVLILDSYTLPVDDEFIQRNNWHKVITITDKMTPSYSADLVIHPGISENWEPTREVKFFAGPKYIPLRKSIAKFRSPSTKKGVLEILVIGGGVDGFNFAEAVCKILVNIEGEFLVRIFSNNHSLAKLDSRFRVVPIGAKLDVYAASAEVVFTTASTTSLEFIAQQVAVGIGCAVDNQEEYYQSLGSAGVAIQIGIFGENGWELCEPKIIELVNSEELRKILRQNASGLFDLGGTGRIVDEILKL